MANSWKLRSQGQIRRQIPLLSSLPLDWVAFWCLRYLINISPFSKLQTKIPRYGSDVFLVKWSSVQLVYANKEATGDDKQLKRRGRRNLCFCDRAAVAHPREGTEWWQPEAPIWVCVSFLCVSRNCVTSRIMTTSPPPWSVSLSGNPKICSISVASKSGVALASLSQAARWSSLFSAVSPTIKLAATWECTSYLDTQFICIPQRLGGIPLAVSRNLKQIK